MSFKTNKDAVAVLTSRTVSPVGPDRGAMSAMRYRHQEDVTDKDDKSQQERRAREVNFRYQHLANDERLLVEKLLSGRLRLELLPRVKSKVIKVFISSTFTGKKQL